MTFDASGVKHVDVMEKAKSWSHLYHLGGMDNDIEHGVLPDMSQ